MKKSYLSSIHNTLLSSKPSKAIRLMLMVLFVSIIPIFSFGQCSFTGATTASSIFPHCIRDANNTSITTDVLYAGEYVIFNVVKGFSYTFSYPNSFGTEKINITLYNSTNTTSPLAFGSSTTPFSTAFSVNWTATFSGQIYILVSRGNCNNVPDPGIGERITIKLNSIGNTQDSQTAFGTDTWVGHIYNSVAGSSPEPFTNANYAGYYDVNSETISENFGGDNACFPVFSNGTRRASIYTESFAIRYRMRSTRPAGYYFMNVSSDDGIRVTVDGVTVLSEWTNHLFLSYCKNLIYLDGSSDIILDYYEDDNGNGVSFSLVPITGNTISSYADINVCSGTSPGNLDGSSILNCTGTSNTTYQWQSSTDNVNFIDIAGATTEDYSPPAVTTTTVNVRYYRRVLKAFGVAITASNPATGSVKVTTNPPAPATPGTITGPTTQCAGNTSQIYSVAAVTNATSYNWTLPLNWTITAGTGTNSITVNIASNGASGNISVNAENSCGTSASSSKTVTITAPTVAGTVTPANTNVCSGSNSTNLTLSGYTGSILRWESSTDNFAGGTITTIANTGSPLTVANLTADRYYRAVVQNGGCNILNTNSVKISVVGAMTNPGGISIDGISYPPNGTATTCASTTMTFSINPIANATSYTWTVGAGWTIVSGQGTSSVSVTTGTTSQNSNISVYATNVACPQTTTAYLWVNLIAPPTKPTGAATQSFCSGATVANLSATGTNIKWYATSTGGTPLVSTTVLTNGTHYYASQNPSGCESPRLDVTATVNSIPSTPIVGAQSNCASSVVLSGLPAGNWTINPGGITGNTSSTTISGLAAGTYNFTVSIGTCTSSATGNVVINPVITNTYNGTTWSAGSAPTNGTQNIVFNAGYTATTNLSGCACTVNSGAVKINSGINLILQGKLTVNTPGTLTFEDSASLVQTAAFTGLNTGNITYKRTTSSVLVSDYTYWSSPVANHTLNISPSYGSGLFYSYNDFAVPEDWKKETASTIMQIGKGYIIRGSLVSGPPPPPTSYNATFLGVPNNGTQTIAIGPTGTSNLLGNPYPSAIDADAFLADNSTIVEGTIYLWTHNTAIQLASNITNGTAGSGLFAYTSDDYASYNGTGGAATSGGITPNGKIAAGQSFFTTSKATGATVTFSNTMRVVGTTLADKTGINQQFFKTKNPTTKTDSNIEKNRVWLNLTNTEGAFKQTLIGYVTDATNEYDDRFDGESFDGNEFVDFYSINQDKNLVIQGRALPFDENDQVPLGFRSTIEGSFTINIEKVDGLLANQAVFIEDKLTNTVFDLKSGNYTFNTVTGTFNDRFVLRYTNKTLGKEEVELNNEIIALYSNNYKTLIIRNNMNDATVNTVELYNMLGQSIDNWDVNENEQTNIQIPIKNKDSGIYIVKINTNKGVFNKKIIIK